MRGSRIAKQIEYEQRREAKRKRVMLELRRRLLNGRGESGGERAEPSIVGNEIRTREKRDSQQGAKS